MTGNLISGSAHSVLAIKSEGEGVHLVAAANGFISFFLMWLTVIWGVILRNGWMTTRVRHSTLYGTHHLVAVLGLTLGTVHAFAQLAIPGKGPVRPVDVVIPFVNPVDPIGIGVGVVGLELMIATAFSVVIQKKLGYSRWRALHSLNYVAFMAVAAHILISGTDVWRSYLWVSVMLAFVVAVILFLTTTQQAVAMRNRVTSKASARTTAQTITVGVDARKCSRYGFCEHEAPGVFMLRADGRLSYRASVPGDLADDVVRAARVCPMRAISMSRVPTAVVGARPPEEEEHVTSPHGVPSATVTGLRNRGADR
jgi:ferredoxin/DMSO/TMAO reductase YedYZ heme-binding membrane subunit